MRKSASFAPRRRTLATLLGAAALLPLLAAPATAQFRWPWESAPKPAEEKPVPPPPAAAPPATPAPTAKVQPPRRPAPAGGEVAQATAPAPAAEATTPAPLPITPVATPGTPAAPAPPLTDEQAVAKANAYFNGLSTLVGEFTQIGGDGRRLGGTLYLSRPGKLRFAYEEPSTLEVIADGRSVAVRDRKLATQDLYTIGQTPLKFLLRDTIDLARDVRVVDVAPDGDGLRIALEDRSTLGGTSKITLFFDRAVETLNRWRVIDPQGFQTTVVLSNVDRTRRVDPRLFVINYERMIDTNR